MVWEDNVVNREWKVEHGEDNIVSLMREIKLKDILLADKTNELNRLIESLKISFMKLGQMYIGRWRYVSV